MADIFAIFGTLLAQLHRIITIKKMPYQSLAIFITGLFSGVLIQFLTLLRGQPAEFSVYAALFWTSLYSGLVGPFLFLPTAWWMRIKTYRFGRR